MSLIFDSIYKHVTILSDRINKLYDIEPYIFLRFGSNGTRVEGACITTYKIPDMLLYLTLPQNFTLGKKHKTLINVLLCHEYCHYIDALHQSARERKKLVALYQVKQHVRKLDEHKTWRQTKVLAKRLGLWNKLFYNCVKECAYTSEIRY